jgi:hypothetical protein
MSKLRVTALCVVSVLVLSLPRVVHAQATGSGATNTPPEVPFRAGGTTPLADLASRPTPRMPDGSVDLWGTWVGGGPINDLAAGLKKGEELPMLPWAKALRESRTNPEDPHNFCLPMGVPRQAGAFPWRFVPYPTHKPPTHLFILWEGFRNYRQVFMDGRKHSEDPTPTWFGVSIGWWEGDTLVIDSIGFNDKFWWDRAGTPHTEQLHIIERWTRVNFATLNLEVTIDDPGAFSRPFTLYFTAKHSAPGDELKEYICEENNQFGLAGGHPNPYRAEPSK